MTYFKRCFVALFTLIILCFCCSCGVNNKAAGVYHYYNTWDYYVVVNSDGTFDNYCFSWGSTNKYGLVYSGEYKVKGDKVTLTYYDSPSIVKPENFTLEYDGSNIILTSELTGETYDLNRVDSNSVTINKEEGCLFDTSNGTEGTNANSVNEATKVTPSINIADDTTDNIDDDYVSPLTSNFTLEMGTDYPVYKSKVAVPEAYIHPDYFSQEIADSIFLAYQDFLFDEVLNNENKSWIDDCEYDWYITSCGAGVYTISFNFTVPSKEYTSLSYETNSTLTFDEYGYYEVSNFALECTG